jgi:CHRD domain
MYRKKIYLLLLLVTLFSFGCGDDENTEFGADLNGASEVPPVNTSATGTARFNLDEESNTLQFTLNVSNISNVVAAHIHTGAVGVNGGIVVFLFGGPQTGTVNGQLSAGTIRSTDVLGITFDQLITNMRTGQAYVNVHTTQNPAGEMRGQVEVLD